MKRIIIVLICTILLLLIGRNLTFLPTFHFSQTEGVQKQEVLSLKKQISNYILKRPGSVSMYFLDLKTGAEVGMNENTIYTVGSVMKANIVAVLYHLASENEVNLDEQITIQKEDIQDYGTGSLRYEEPGSVYSLKTLARLSMEQSDNTAAHILGNKLDIAKIQDVINSFGLTQTDMENNKISLKDMAMLFKDIFDGKIANEVLTKELLDIMNDSLFEDRLSALLPKDVKLYHKTGDVTGGIHDVGIVVLGDKSYFIGVMTADQADEDEAKKTIAEISKMVYDSLNR